ncbi:GPI inositol-deacylase [Stylophora pistillata]|uniref:GPI inositol-deacylase n=1 Tax=Stylophora pistillata TaxID=50429 RepID=A0A2B4RG48_STYPI|nr:GPI inositol-deacylase [Stylophora pistillata]
MSWCLFRPQQLILITWFAVFTAFVLIGFRDFLSNLEENRCDMTWMYEWPQYIKVPMWKGTTKRFPRYALYLYGEGDYADKSKGLHLGGIPVLFIPGNAGSYKQVRSLASVALRKAVGLRSHFNYFTADFDESLSGVFGGVLNEQTEFVRLCVSRIVWLYKNTDSPPTSVILIGHSMGGLIARGLFTLPKFDTSFVHTIITYGTPHRHPILPFDPQLINYYENVNRFWRSHALVNDTTSRMKNVTVVSVSGGVRDVLVRSSPSSLHHLILHSQTISVVTTSVPRVWISVDHLCLCWCQQLVLVSNRALFDMIDPNTQQITENKQQRVAVLQHHFLRNPGPSKVTFNSVGNINGRERYLAKDFNRLVTHKRLWRYTGNEQILLLFPRDEWSATHDTLMILTTSESDQWLYGCPETSGQACNSTVDLSYHASLLPWNGSVIKHVKLKLNAFEGIAYFAVIVSSSRKRTSVWSEYQSSGSLVYDMQLPGVLSIKSRVLVIPSDSLFANITLKSVVKSWRVFVFHFEALDCDARKSLLVTRIHVPWFNEDVYRFSSNGSVELVLKLHHPKPIGNKQHVQIHMWLDPKCSYRISAKYDFFQTLGQIYRFYAVQLPCWTFSVVMLVFAWQLSSMVYEKQCESFFSLATSASKSLRVVLLVVQIHFFSSQLILAFYVLSGESGQHDWLPNIDDLKTYIWLLPLILIISTALIIVIALFVVMGMVTNFGGFILSYFESLPYVQRQPGVVLGVNMIVFDPLVKVPRLLVYLCFVLGIAVTHAVAIPMHMIPYIICLLFTVLNLYHFFTGFKRRKED